MVHHPDRASSPEAKKEAAGQFAKIGEAYTAILGESEFPTAPTDAAELPHMEAPAATGYPSWMYRLVAHLQRVPARFDRWLMPSYSSIIYQHLRKNELAPALQALEEMRAEASLPLSPHLPQS